MEFEKVKQELKKFAEERGWGPHHTPKDLAIKLSVEAAEVLELFEWLGDEEVAEAMENEEFREALAGEFADVFIILLNLTRSCDIDLLEAFEKKHEKNKKRFPVEKSKLFDPLQAKLKKLRGKKEFRF